MVTISLILSGCVSTGGASQNRVIKAKDRVAPALVHVSPVKEVFQRGQRREVTVTGSGFIISADGYVVTNEHVAGENDYVRCVLFNKEEVEAEVVGTDPYTDIAVLKLRTEHTDLPFVDLGSSEALIAGETVMAMGSPHGLSRSVSLGIVSVTDRNLERMGSTGAPYNNWIQTDAAINPGNSGGPLVNVKGQVIGINTRKLSGADNVGFAIPIDIARDVIYQIIEQGRVNRSTIGIAFQEMTRLTDDPTVEGVLIGDVDPLMPAFKAGIRPGDVLLTLDGVATNARFTEDLPPIRKLVADLPIGHEVKLKVQRLKQVAEVPITTVEKSERKGDQVEFSEWGFTVSELTDAIIRRAQLSSDNGVMVSGTRQGESAAQAGILPGDIILNLDEDAISKLDDFSAKYNRRIESSQKLTLVTIKRGALTMYRIVKNEKNETEE
jgi:serine protease Do